MGALADVQWSPESFDCLKIPPKTKMLLSSLAKTRLDLVPALPFDDIIDGKGRGLNILLQYVGRNHPSIASCLISFFLFTFPSGPPGVGKTFTVEATAERFNLPLYSVSIIQYI